MDAQREPSAWHVPDYILAPLVVAALGAVAVVAGYLLMFYPAWVFLCVVGIGIAAPAVLLRHRSAKKPRGQDRVDIRPRPPGKAFLISLLLSLFLVPPLLLTAVFLAPSVYSRLFYEPPQIGESAEDLMQRLGPPDLDSSIEEPGEKPRFLGYYAPDGMRIKATLDSRDVVVEVERWYR